MIRLTPRKTKFLFCIYSEKMKARRLNSNLGKFAKYQNVICNVSTILVIDKQFESSNNRFLKYATENGIKIINAQDKSTDSLFEEINKYVKQRENSFILRSKIINFLTHFN